MSLILYEMYPAEQFFIAYLKFKFNYILPSPTPKLGKPTS